MKTRVPFTLLDASSYHIENGTFGGLAHTGATREYNLAHPYPLPPPTPHVKNYYLQFRLIFNILLGGEVSLGLLSTIVAYKYNVC